MDVTTTQGLLDLIAVGCLVELSVALDDRTYTKQIIPDDEVEEIEATTTRYRRFATWFAHRFVVVIDNEWVSAHYIFKRRLVDFGATVVLYVEQQMQDTHLSDLPPYFLTNKFMLKLIQMHLTSGYPDLVPAFMIALQSPSRRLYYSGPPFHIKRRDHVMRSLRVAELHDFAGAPLATNQLQAALTRAMEGSDSSEDDDDAEGEEESSPLSSPSPSESSMRPPPAPSTPTRKRGPPSSTPTSPSKTPSSSRPKKKQAK
jgi:hypothetical protein